MKIVITVTTDIIFDHRIKRIARSLASHGHQVKVYGRSKGIHYNAKELYEYFLIRCWFNTSFLFYAEYNIRLFFILLFSKWDLLCACDLDTLLGGTIAALLKKKKLVFDAHEYFEESIEIVHKKLIKKIWEWIARICIPHTQLRYTVSQSLADALSAKYGLEFKVIRNVPLYNSSVSRETLQKIIWYQGAINNGRGLECMMECMMELKDYSFYLAGSGDLLSKLQERVQLLNLENRIRFVGRLNYSEMAEYASFAYIGIDLLESESKSYYFSLSNKTFDYMQIGLPSIQMNFPEYKKIHEQFKIGVLIDKVEKENIINAIRQLENPEYYKNCLQACKDASKIYNWEVEEKVLIRMYEEIGIEHLKN